MERMEAGRVEEVSQAKQAWRSFCSSQNRLLREGASIQRLKPDITDSMPPNKELARLPENLLG